MKTSAISKKTIFSEAKEMISESREEIIYSSVIGTLLFALSLAVNYAANIFALNRIGNPVNDLILDNIQTYNVDVVFFQGFGLFFALVVSLLIIKPKRIPFALKSFAVFVLVRSAFIMLTHMGPPENEMFFDPGEISRTLTSGGDLFFSSHTGFPFLAALLFWNDKALRYIFLAISFIFGAAVLLGHLHYSIDVFSAFFITYGIYHISRTFFKKDMKLFEKA